MGKSGLVLIAAAASLVAACEPRTQKDGAEPEAGSNAASSAEGKAEEGRIALSAPGFDLKLQIPLEQARTRGDTRILYPGARLTGMYIAAHPDQASGSDGEVELRFSTPARPDTVASWYRDPARGGDLSVTSSAREGAGWTIAGEQKDGGKHFRVRLEPDGTGTDGRLTLRDRS